MYDAQGYRITTPIQLCNAIAAYNSGQITLSGLRVFFACLELTAIREAAARTTKRHGGSIRYSIAELTKLTGLTIQPISRALSALEHAQVISFSESQIVFTETPLSISREMLQNASAQRKGTRLIPVPRTFLRFLARSKKTAVTKSLVAYLIRGLSLDRGNYKRTGSCKAEWIASSMGLSLRAVRSARAELITLGLISADASSQWKLNRCGAYFEINTAWSPSKDSAGEGEAERRDLTQSRSEASAGLDTPQNMSEFAPPQAEICTESAPPNRDLLTPNGLRNQKPQKTAGPGVSGKPNLRNIKPEDLRLLASVLELFTQAVKARWLADTEANRLNFVAAAIRARKVGTASERVFVSIVKRGLWHHITQEQEDQARALLKTRREREQRNLLKNVTEIALRRAA